MIQTLEQRALDSYSDGIHIKALLINIFHHFRPKLLKLQDRTYIYDFVTPFIKVSFILNDFCLNKIFYLVEIKAPPWLTKLPKRKLRSEKVFFLAIVQQWKTNMGEVVTTKWKISHFKVCFFILMVIFGECTNNVQIR